MSLPAGWEQLPDTDQAMGPHGEIRAIEDLLQEPSPNGNRPTSYRRRRLWAMTVRQLEERVRAVGPPTWLIERLWPGDA